MALVVPFSLLSSLPLVSVSRARGSFLNLVFPFSRFAISSFVVHRSRIFQQYGISVSQGNFRRESSVNAVTLQDLVPPLPPLALHPSRANPVALARKLIRSSAILFHARKPVARVTDDARAGTKRESCIVSRRRVNPIFPVPLTRDLHSSAFLSLGFPRAPRRGSSLSRARATRGSRYTRTGFHIRKVSGFSCSPAARSSHPSGGDRSR